jgi:peptide/nickel transport system permease protein
VLSTEDLPTVAVAEPVGEEASRAPVWAITLGLAGSLAVLVAGLESWFGLGGTPRLIVCGLALVGTAVLGLRFLHRIFGAEAHVELWLSAGWLGLLTLAAIFADLLPLAEAREPKNTLTDPILLRPDLFSHHPFGTDRLALDILGGVIYGARVSLVVGVGAVAIGMAIGLPLGMLAGYYRRHVETAIDFVTNVMLAFPPIVLLLAMVSVVKPSMYTVAGILGVITIPIYIRIAKLNTTQYAKRDFILAAQVSGAKNRRILARELLPCVLPPVLAYGVVVVAVAIVAEASLSFLGLSIQRPEPTWGNMIAAGQDTYTKNPHLVFVPGTVLVVTVLALNHVNQVLRRRASGQSPQL